MYPSKLGAMVVVLATAAAFSALTGSAQAQISGSIGGDVVDHHPVPVFGDPHITLTGGNLAFQWGRGEAGSWLTGTVS